MGHIGIFKRSKSEDYWPKEDAPADENAWKNALQQIRKDRDEFIALLNDPASDLYIPFPHGSGQNLLREAMLIADHTSYHTGQIVVIRRLLMTGVDKETNYLKLHRIYKKFLLVCYKKRKPSK